jgi:hypothetical protein
MAVEMVLSGKHQARLEGLFFYRAIAGCPYSYHDEAGCVGEAYFTQNFKKANANH